MSVGCVMIAVKNSNARAPVSLSQMAHVVEELRPRGQRAGALAIRKKRLTCSAAASRRRLEAAPLLNNCACGKLNRSAKHRGVS